MNSYLASMIARDEHILMNQSRQPVLDFDRRGHVNKPGLIGTLFQFLSSTLAKARMSLRYEQEQTITREIPLSDRG